MPKLAIVMALAIFVTPALAASEYWVVQADPSVRKCTVMQRDPDADKAEPLPAGAVGPYQTQAQAEAVIQREQRCGGGSE